MSDFLETPRFPSDISYGSSGGPEYRTLITETGSGREYRDKKWSYPRHGYNAANGVKTHTQLETLLAYFHVCGGRAYGFRYKDWLDFKSCALASSPAATDQELGDGDGSTLAFQLIKTYTLGSMSQVRLIKKPVSGTTLVGIDGVAQTGRWSVDTTTGIVTFSANIQKNITGATTANPCVLSVSAHGLLTGDSVWLSGFTGDWAALNGARYLVTKVDANLFSIPVDTSAFTPYSSNGGVFNTIPQVGETVSAGYEFDVPLRFGVDKADITLEAFELGSLDLPAIEIKPF